MDPARFDRVVIALAAAPTRRGAVRLLAGGALGAVLVRLGLERSAAVCTSPGGSCTATPFCCTGAVCQANKCCRPAGGRCTNKGQCCSGRCNKAKRKCLGCQDAAAKPCGGACVTCSDPFASQVDPTTCQCCTPVIGCGGQLGTAGNCCAGTCKLLPGVNSPGCECKTSGRSCTADRDCCSNVCSGSPKACTCLGPGGACTRNAQCCGGDCGKNGKCQ